MSSGGFSELSADHEDVSGLPEPDEADVTELSLRLLLWRAEGADREGARWYLIRSSVVDLYKAWCDQHEADCVACAQETMSGGFHTSWPWLLELWPMDDCYPSIEVAGTAGAASYIHNAFIYGTAFLYYRIQWARGAPRAAFARRATSSS